MLAMTLELLSPADRPPALALPLFAALATPPAVRTFRVFIAIVLGGGGREVWSEMTAA